MRRSVCCSMSCSELLYKLVYELLCELLYELLSPYTGAIAVSTFQHYTGVPDLTARVHKLGVNEYFPQGVPLSALVYRQHIYEAKPGFRLDRELPVYMYEWLEPTLKVTDITVSVHRPEVGVQMVTLGGLV